MGLEIIYFESTLINVSCEMFYLLGLEYNFSTLLEYMYSITCFVFFSNPILKTNNLSQKKQKS